MQSPPGLAEAGQPLDPPPTDAALRRSPHETPAGKSGSQICFPRSQTLATLLKKKSQDIVLRRNKGSSQYCSVCPHTKPFLTLACSSGNPMVKPHRAGPPAGRALSSRGGCGEGPRSLLLRCLPAACGSLSALDLRSCSGSTKSCTHGGQRQEGTSPAGRPHAGGHAVRAGVLPSTPAPASGGGQDARREMNT